MKTEDLSVKELARSRGVTIKWIYDLLAMGRLQGAKKVGRVWRIPKGTPDANSSPQVIRKGFD